MQALIFCRTNFDCDNLEKFFNSLAGGQAFRGRKDTGPEAQYSCCVLGGARSMDQRRESLQVCVLLPASQEMLSLSQQPVTLTHLMMRHQALARMTIWAFAS